MVTAFVGFVGGWHQANMGWAGAVLGCLVATYFTFLPSFLFILLGAPFIEQMRGELRLSAALSGITAAVVGVVLYLAVFFGGRVFVDPNKQIQWFSIAIATVAFIALWRFKIGIVRVVLACGMVGALAWLVNG
jgi:chromate transporter